MPHAIDQLLSSEMLSEEVRTTLSEAWEAKLTEAREEITAELREEFAQRYDADKSQMVEAIDAMLKDTITAELREFAEDKKAAIQAKIDYKRQIAEHASLLESFVMKQLEAEVRELRADRKLAESNMSKLEGFVMEQLASELNEFHADRKDLLEQKVKLVKEGKKVIAESKREFVAKASAKLAKIVESTITSELGMLKEDIKSAKENMFGRKLFETFAAEFMNSHLSEGTHISKLSKQLLSMKEQLAESRKEVAEKEAIIESVQKKAQRVMESREREQTLNALLKPLAKDKRELMTSLLESVATPKLKAAFNKYLPTVLNENTAVKAPSKSQLNESRTSEVTGNKTAAQDSGSEADIINLRKLAGIIK